VLYSKCKQLPARFRIPLKRKKSDNSKQKRDDYDKAFNCIGIHSNKDRKNSEEVDRELENNFTISKNDEKIVDQNFLCQEKNKEIIKLEINPQKIFQSLIAQITKIY
jgi:hypothetical protein